jgi:two-component system chemotaxis response regulator CheB
MPPARIDLIAMGASTGGPNALATVLSALPKNLSVPVVVVQHMPAAFTKQLADRLSKQTVLDVREALDGALLEPGQVWIGAGDFHMEVATSTIGMRLHLHKGAPENSCRPSVDVLLRSAAAACGSHSLAVILTGMGRDGCRGCELIREAGGQILAQDEASSIVWGMPGLVTRAGLADQVVPLQQMGPEILRRLRCGRSTCRVDR